MFLPHRVRYRCRENSFSAFPQRANFLCDTAHPDTSCKQVFANRIPVVSARALFNFRRFGSGSSNGLTQRARVCVRLQPFRAPRLLRGTCLAPSSFGSWLLSWPLWQPWKTPPRMAFRPFWMCLRSSRLRFPPWVMLLAARSRVPVHERSPERRSQSSSWLQFAQSAGSHGAVCLGLSCGAA